MYIEQNEKRHYQLAFEIPRILMYAFALILCDHYFWRNAATGELISTSTMQFIPNNPFYALTVFICSNLTLDAKGTSSAH